MYFMVDLRASIVDCDLEGTDMYKWGQMYIEFFTKPTRGVLDPQKKYLV